MNLMKIKELQASSLLETQGKGWLNKKLCPRLQETLVNLFVQKAKHMDRAGGRASKAAV